MKIEEIAFPKTIIKIAQDFSDRGGQALLVGGAVRDAVMGCLVDKPPDYDIEVFGLSLEDIFKVLVRYGQPKLVGKQFGVFQMKIGDQECDFSIPRRENKAGIGHTGFTVWYDPTMTIADAAARRDYTIDSMSIDILTRELYDPYNGQHDAHNYILRHTSKAFSEDPLRVFRGMQLASRYCLGMQESTVEMCKAMAAEYETLSKERIWEEWKKWALGPWPFLGLTILQQTGWIKFYYTLNDMVDTVQDPEWHPEGNVWDHTMLAVRQASNGQWLPYSSTDPEHTDDSIIVAVFAALLHDSGKPSVTASYDDHIRSNGHESYLKPACDFMEDIGMPNKYRERIIPLIKEHMAHISAERATERMVLRLSKRLEPATIDEWWALCMADAHARGDKPATDTGILTEIKQLARKLRVQDKVPAPLLMGRHLLAEGVMKPGPEMGELLKVVYEAQLDNKFKDTYGAFHYAVGYLDGAKK